MNKIGEYIQSTFKEEQSYPGRLLVSSREFFKISELYDHLFDLKTSITSLPKENDLYGNRMSYTANGDTIDLFYLLKKKISRVKMLQIHGNNVNELYQLSLSQPFSSLIHIRLDMIPPSTISGLYELRSQLQSLEITNSGIVDLSLIFIPKAKDHYELLTSLMPMVNHNEYNVPKEYQWLQLISLKLLNCGIVRLDESFHFMPLLASLTIEKNSVTRIVHLQDCYRLKFLNFASNRISNISNLPLVLGNVKVLDLSDNRIEVLAGFQKLYSLQHVNLSNNQISDFDEIRNLSNLPMLEGMDFRGNIIADDPDYRINVFRQFINDGIVNRAFPILDRENIHESELKRFKGLMFRSLAMEETLTFRSSIDNNEPSVNISRALRRSKSLDGDRNQTFITPPQSFSFRRQSSLTGTPLSAPPALRTIASSDKHDVQFYRRCKPLLLGSWQQHRQVAKVSVDPAPSSSSGHGKRRTAFIAVSDDDGLTIFPSLHEIKESIRQTREQKRIEAVEYQMNPLIEVLDERQLSFETKRHVIGRLSSDDSRLIPVIQDMQEPNLILAGAEIDLNGKSDHSSSNIQLATLDRLDSISSAVLDRSPSLSAAHSTTDRSSILNYDSAILNTSQAQYLSSAAHECDSDISQPFSTRIYSGAEEYASLDVMENLELYFREQIFGTYKSTGDAPYIRLQASTRLSIQDTKTASSPRTNKASDDIIFISPPSRPERFMALFCEEVLLIDKPKPSWKPPHASKNHPSPSVDSLSSSPLPEKPMKVSEEKSIKMIIALTNTMIYVLRYDELVGKRFLDAPIPVLVNSHDIVDLMYCSIFFGFQRCLLSFIGNRSSTISIEPTYAFIDFHNIDEISSEFLTSYMIVTRDKARTYPIITKIPQISNAARGLLAGEKPYRNVRINNRDDELTNQVIEKIKQLGSYDPDVVHYQMLYQTWRKHPGVLLPRTIILTPSLFLLIEEDLYCKDVRINLIDNAPAKDVHKVILEDDPSMITIIFKPSSKMFSMKRKWRLVAAYPTAVTRLYDECKRLCATHGNQDI